MKLKCQCCGFEQEFDSRERRFRPAGTLRLFHRRRDRQSLPRRVHRHGTVPRQGCTTTGGNRQADISISSRAHWMRSGGVSTSRNLPITE